MIPEQQQNRSETSANKTSAVSEHHNLSAQRWVRWSLTILIMIAIGVFFWLPSYVEKPQIRTEDVVSSAHGNKPRGSETSPWLDAQLARQRKAAQEILAQLLDLQFSLEEKAARQWAADDFKAVEKFAAEGDKSYRAKQFLKSAKYYQQGLDKLQLLENNSTQVLAKLLEEGRGFFLQQNSEQAIQQFELALAIDPENTIAKTGLRRSQVLDQVLALQAKAEDEFKKDNLQEALETIDTALVLDSENLQSAADRAVYANALNELKFSQAMSQGYGALLEKNYRAAERAFGQAALLKPGASEALTALSETAEKQSLEQINKLHREAKQRETEELWSSARTLYEAALKIDDNLIFARVGAIRTTAREKLHNRIQTILDTPHRLSDRSVFQDTESLLKDAQAIQQPGKKLLLQIQSLQTSLDIAALPLTVRLHSDNQTQVKINRIGGLGNFEYHELKLRPGTYVATGSRAGYRDIRLEFTVSAANPGKIITIQCIERI